MPKAIIIDDEPDCVQLMALQLKNNCPQVQAQDLLPGRKRD
jgi:hypothetical protein